MPVVWLLQVMQDWKTYEPNQCVTLWTHTSIQSGVFPEGWVELGIPMSRRRLLRKTHEGCLLLRPALNCRTRSPLNAARRTNGHSFLKALNNVLRDIFHNMTYCLKRRVEYFNALEPKSSFKHTASSLYSPRLWANLTVQRCFKIRGMVFNPLAFAFVMIFFEDSMQNDEPEKSQRKYLLRGSPGWLTLLSWA